MEFSISPKRAIINFTKKCALNCEWCYVPFEAKPISSQVLDSVLLRLYALGFDSITLGGGDPFQYKEITCLVKKAKDLGMFVHIDTHTKALAERVANAELLEHHVDLLGVPLDGSSSLIHDSMRDAIGHYELIRTRLKWLGGLDIDIKINSIISAVNKDDAVNLARLVQSIQPVRWSIYQYWPVGPAIKAASKHSLFDQEFSEVIDKIELEMLGHKSAIEVNSSESRRRTYPILDHSGEVFIHSEYPRNDFEHLGSIFDSNIEALISAIPIKERENAVSRYQD